MLSGTLLADAVTWLFTSVLKGLQTHGQHDGCMASLVHLAFQIYEALVSRESMEAGWLRLHLSQLAPIHLGLILNTGSCQVASAAQGVSVVGNREVAGPKPIPH